MAAPDEHRRWLRDELTASVRRLADSPGEQVAYLRELGSPESADELALEFDDVAAAAVAEPQVLSEAQAAMVNQLVELLEEISGSERAELWTPDALQSAPEWKAIRASASQLLATLEGTPA